MAYGVTFAATAASWYLGTSLLSGGHIRASEVLLYANPIQAMLTILRGPIVSPRVAYVVINGSVPPLTPPPWIGPALQPWQPTVLIELAVVVLAVAGTVLLLRERRGLSSGPA